MAGREARYIGLAVLLLGAGCNTGVIGLGGKTGASVAECTDENSFGCADGTSDSAAASEESSGQRICEPGTHRCASDSSDVVQCDENGTAWVKAGTCTAQQACVNKRCVEAGTTLGEVTVLGPAENMQEVPLAPGKYGLAVVNNVIATNARELHFPVQISGELLATNAATVHARLRHPLPPLDRPPPWRLHAGEGALATARSLAQPCYYRVGDRRVFNYHEYQSSSSTPTLNRRTGELRHSGTSVNIWEDITSAAKGSVISDADLSELVRRVDNGGAARDVAIFGATSDVDGNGKFDVFLTEMLAGKPGYADTAALYPRGYFPDTDFGEVIYYTRGRMRRCQSPG